MYIKNKNRILHAALALLISCSSINAIAEQDAKLDDTEKASTNSADYDANYYENEGRLLFKVRALGVISEGKHRSLPKATASNPVSVGSLIKNGKGADTSTTLFFNDNIGAELSLGFIALRTKKAALDNISKNYNGTNPGKRKDIYMIPLTFTMDWHVAPFGAIRPFVGAGYHGAYLFSKAKEFNIKNTHGPVLHLGIDFVAKDDTLITFDVKKYWSKPKLVYKTGFLGRSSFSSRLKLDPVLIGVGLGIQF